LCCLLRTNINKALQHNHEVAEQIFVQGPWSRGGVERALRKVGNKTQEVDDKTSREGASFHGCYRPSKAVAQILLVHAEACNVQ
jgi:hypothetical protein